MKPVLYLMAAVLFFILAFAFIVASGNFDTASEQVLLIALMPFILVPLFSRAVNK